VPATMQLPGTGHGFSWHPDFDIQMLNRLQRENLAGGGHPLPRRNQDPP